MKQPVNRQDSPLSVKDCCWWVVATLCATWLAYMGVQWMATRLVAVTTPAPSVAASVSESHETPPAHPWPPLADRSEPFNARTVERTFSHNEAARATVENMRRHAREDPYAADVLSEERIKAIEEQGLLVN